MKKLKFVSTLFALILAILVVGGVKTSASTLALSEAEKLDFYNQYLTIIEEINAGEPNATLELAPFESLTDEDFINPSEFEAYAIQRSNVTFTKVEEPKSENSITPFSTVYNSANTTVASNGTNVKLTISSSFETNYSNINLRQLFTGINYINVTTNWGTWVKGTSTGYTASLVDGGRSYNVVVTGKIKQGIVDSNHNIPITYFCKTDGSVSSSL